jgi:hypothetical protein
MIATIPPLWRDLDAYNQVTQDPLVATFWGHAPAYCYAAKVPLFLGDQLERLRGIAVTSPRSESFQLTNSGVWLLIIAQHLALCGAAFYFILAISKFFWVRLVLALIWASNAFFYTFAHCVGSETLSMILVALVVVRALRLTRSRCEPRWIDWYFFAIGLCLCVLSRHVNLWLILLLPTAFLLSWAQSRASSLLASGDRQRRWLRQLGARALRQAVIATAIGIACLAVANSSTQALARKTRFHPHSRIGFTFLWRLHFLKTLSPPSHIALLRKVAARTHSTDARKLIALLEQMHEEGAGLNAEPFLQRAIHLLFPLGGAVQWEKLDGALNEMAFAFLLPPTPEHLHVARTEFVAALKMPVTEISSYLFEATAYYFQHKDEMPACAELSTFRGANADQIRLTPSQHRYFRLWEGLTYNKALAIWFSSLLVFAVMALRKKVNAAAISAFGIALTAVGLLMIASTCLLGAFIPRFGLPMWQLLLLSLYIFVGGTADLFATAGFKRFARPSMESKQSAGQRYRPENVRGCRSWVKPRRTVSWKVTAPQSAAGFP